MDSVTIRDIARKCGVGVSTVSRAMNNHPDINPQTREKILRVIRESGYVPNNSARNLKRADARAVALLVKGMDNMFFTDIIHIIERDTQEQGYACILQQVEDGENELEIALELVKEKKLRGIIFLGGSFVHPPALLKRLTVPYVISTIGQQENPEGYIGGSVSVDNRKESCKAVNYLCSLGHRRIAVLAAGEDDRSIGRLRMEGYRQALAENGIPFDPALVVYMEASADGYSMKSGYRMTRRLLETGTDFTALYATADTLAMGACRALKESGVRVPEDCSIMGFDGLEAGRYYIPSLTTLEQPAEEMAHATVDHLFRLIRKQEAPKRLFFEGRLVIRESAQKYGGANGKTPAAENDRKSKGR